ncbi:MAG: hypothetical protein U5O16_24200 [Rhodococcus sp. (in: high G+C Gram-positive bacteria)]|uniref:hypothetical protein n=1 Tax=Rhodococcus sp. TaxID=1831 RepID=UPI002ADB098A|nr:hypothetical protein [Rhodococcus sp. (in: high G+C Gram-positive bacteria)]
MYKRRSTTADDLKLPEERAFAKTLICVCVGVVLFLCSFGVLTAVKVVRSPYDITSNWFVAWGTWAGGLGTAAAFLLAAVSISVAGAHTRFDRREAARLREDDEMAQARLMTVYKVEGERSIDSLPTYRIENRSKETFFDVTVPYVDSPYGADDKIERRNADLVVEDNRLHEFIPTGAELTPYRDHTEYETWFTLVTVHTTDASRITFEVEYTDANGRRWSRDLGGVIKRMTTTKAVPVRPPDRFQPPQQISPLSKMEAWRSGFTSGLERPETDAEYLEVFGSRTVKIWKPIERIGDVEVRPNNIDIPPEGLIAVVTFRPAAPPFWSSYFHAKLADSGLNYGGGSSQYDQTDKFRLAPDVDPNVGRITELVDDALEHANNSFEKTEIAAARRALDAQSSHRSSARQ